MGPRGIGKGVVARGWVSAGSEGRSGNRRRGRAGGRGI